MTEQAAQAKFLQGNLMRHVAVMSATSSVGLMAVFLVDFIDMVFISMLGKSELAAAVGYAGAILFFTTSISIGIAIAAGALVSRNLGAGDETSARRMASHVLVFGVAIAIVISALVFANLAPLLEFMGASGDTLSLGIGYLAIVVPSMPLMVVAMVGGALLRAHGDAKRAMWATLIGGIVNAILDPILIFGLGMELQGAALASVAARVAFVLMTLIPIYRYYGGLSMPHFGALFADLKQIATIAVPAMLTNIATPIGVAYVTREMAQFGESAVAGMAVISRLTPVSFAIIFALSGAIGPIIGQNFGAESYTRVRRALIDSAIFVGISVLLISTALFLLRAQIAALFDADGDALILIYLFCGPLALAWFFNGIIFVGNAAFNNLGHPFNSTLINWARNTLGTIPFVALGATWYGAPGILIGQAAGGVIFAAISWFMAMRLISNLESGETLKRTRPDFSRRARVMQMLHLRR